MDYTIWLSICASIASILGFFFNYKKRKPNNKDNANCLLYWLFTIKYIY